jgi:hypothetical protein
VNDDVSEQEHVFVLSPSQGDITLAKMVLQSQADIFRGEGETRFFS